jgi:hypothetical protein
MAIQSWNWCAAALVLIHFVISTVHGVAHQRAMVELSSFGNAYVIIVITVAPLLATALLFTSKREFGALLFAGSMFGSFAFGVWYHFLSNSGDNIAEVKGTWHSTFLWTAVLLAVIEFLGVLAGVMAYRQIKRVKNFSGPG